MKIKDGFMLREVAGQWVVVPLGERVVEFNGIMTLSESGAILWKVLEKDVSEKELTEAIIQKYDVDLKTAEQDVHEFVNVLQEQSLIQ